MKYRILGKTGLKVSELCLGTMTFGDSFYNIGEVDQDLAYELVAKALESGVNFFDTADVYSYGKSEVLLGRALKNSKVMRDKVVIATKVRSPMSKAATKGNGDFNNVGLSRKHIIEACNASLKRLKVEYIDLYQVHGWDILTPIEETVYALDYLVKQGKVLYTGCSNWSARHLMKAVTFAKENNLSSFVSLQAYYSLIGRDLEYELLPLCKEEGLGVLPWSPLSGGFLTGKFRKEKIKPKESRRTKFDFPPINEERGFDAIDALTDIAKNYNVTIPAVALAWLLAQRGVTSVIIGAKKIKQLEENLTSSEISLSDNDLERLSEITQLRAIYPNWMYDMQNEGR